MQKQRHGRLSAVEILKGQKTYGCGVTVVAYLPGMTYDDGDE